LMVGAVILWYAWRRPRENQAVTVANGRGRTNG
jgi:hypothetical protein